MGILEGKNILVAGVTLNTSIGYRVAEIAQAEGAKVVVSNFGRAMSLTSRVLKRLDPEPKLTFLEDLPQFPRFPKYAIAVDMLKVVFVDCITKLPPNA